jgi:replicative superfamily II helicase
MNFKLTVDGDVNPTEVKDFIANKYLTKEQIKHIIKEFNDTTLLEFLEYPTDYHYSFVDNKDFDKIYWDLIYDSFPKWEREFLKNLDLKLSSFVSEELDDAIREATEDLIADFVENHLKDDKELSLRIMHIKMEIAS